MSTEDENPFAPEVLDVQEPEAEGGRLDPDTRAAIIVFVQRHITKHGRQNWARVYEEFSEIPQRTVRRWIDKVINGEVTNEEVLVSSIADAKRSAKKLGMSSAAAAHLPAAPAPSVIAAAGADAHRSIDFMAQLKTMIDDLEMLREWSMAEKDGKKGIRNAMYFTQAIKLRIQVLDTALRAMAEIWNLGKMQDMYDMVLEEVGRASPDVQKAIMERLKALNDRRGLTVSARPGR